MRKRIILTILSLLLLAGLPACGKTVTEEENPDTTLQASGSVLQSETDRITDVDISGGDEGNLVQGNGEFALDLYLRLKEQDGNLLFSPYSISSALAMTYAGANGTTAEQMASAMHYDLLAADLNPAFNWLDTELTSRGQDAEGKDGEEFRFHVANALWGQKGYEFRQSFLDTLAENYGAGLRIVDYRSDAEKARTTINDWVSEQTEDRIQNLIPPGAIDSSTRLVLTNAVYFNAGWAEKFFESSTQNAPFYLLDGSEIMTPMMHSANSWNYAESDDYQAVELPYDGDEISMVILLPAEGAFNTFESGLDNEQLDSIINRMDDRRVILDMPRFKFESRFSLKEALVSLGMTEAFTPDADFSGMSPEKEDFFIGNVIHKAYIDVDESGTEAAAATAVIMVTSAMPSDPEEPVRMTVDRPFIFLIRDIETGAILFLGRVVNPEE